MDNLARRRLVAAIIFVFFGVLIAVLGYNFSTLPKLSTENEYSYQSRILTGYTGILVGISFLIIGIYILKFIGKREGTEKREEEIGRSMEKGSYLIRVFHEKLVVSERSKWNILIDIGLPLVAIGLVLWTLVCLGVLGSGPSDILSYSSPVASLGTLLISVGAILSGIGVSIPGVISYFRK